MLKCTTVLVVSFELNWVKLICFQYYNFFKLSISSYFINCISIYSVRTGNKLNILSFWHGILTYTWNVWVHVRISGNCVSEMGAVSMEIYDVETVLPNVRLHAFGRCLTKCDVSADASIWSSAGKATHRALTYIRLLGIISHFLSSCCFSCCFGQSPGSPHQRFSAGSRQSTPGLWLTLLSLAMQGRLKTGQH